MGDLDARRAAYLQALRHSRRVRRLKILLPVGRLWFLPFFVVVSIVELSARQYRSEGCDDRKRPDRDGEASDLRTQRRRHLLFHDRGTGPAEHRFAQHHDAGRYCRADAVNDQLIAKVNAKGGIYDRSANTLDMTQPFSLHLSKGWSRISGPPKLDVKNGTMSSNDTVSITASKATVVAQSINIEDKGQTIIFDGRVQVNLSADSIHDKGN